MKSQKTLVLVGIVCLCLVVGGVFFVRKQQEQERQEKIAAAVTLAGPSILAQAFKMPDEDFKKLQNIKESVLQSQQISDADLDWVLAWLKPSTSSLVRSKIFAMLQLLGNAPQSQKDKIKIAIAPFLNDNDPLYRNSVKKVQKLVLNE